MWRGCRTADHVDGPLGRHPAAGLPHLARAHPARLPRRQRDLAAAEVDPHRAYTPATITDLQALVERISADHAQGFAIVDEELERGLRSIAVPIVNREGEALGAINVSTHTTQATRNEMREHFLPGS